MGIEVTPKSLQEELNRMKYQIQLGMRTLLVNTLVDEAVEEFKYRIHTEISKRVSEFSVEMIDQYYSQMNLAHNVSVYIKDTHSGEFD